MKDKSKCNLNCSLSFLSSFCGTLQNSLHGLHNEEHKNSFLEEFETWNMLFRISVLTAKPSTQILFYQLLKECSNMAEKPVSKSQFIMKSKLLLICSQNLE